MLTISLNIRCKWQGCTSVLLNTMSNSLSIVRQETDLPSTDLSFTILVEFVQVKSVQVNRAVKLTDIDLKLICRTNFAKKERFPNEFLELIFKLIFENLIKVRSDLLYAYDTQCYWVHCFVQKTKNLILKKMNSMKSLVNVRVFFIKRPKNVKCRMNKVTKVSRNVL